MNDTPQLSPKERQAQISIKFEKDCSQYFLDLCTRVVLQMLRVEYSSFLRKSKKLNQPKDDFYERGETRSRGSNL
jgi:hypothetical protein